MYVCIGYRYVSSVFYNACQPKSIDVSKRKVFCVQFNSPGSLYWWYRCHTWNGQELPRKIFEWVTAWTLFAYSFPNNAVAISFCWDPLCLCACGSTFMAWATAVLRSMAGRQLAGFSWNIGRSGTASKNHRAPAFSCSIVAMGKTDAPVVVEGETFEISQKSVRGRLIEITSFLSHLTQRLVQVKSGYIKAIQHCSGYLWRWVSMTSLWLVCLLSPPALN